MTTFLTIPDKIQELSKGEIQKRRLSPLFPILLIVIALPLLWIGGQQAYDHPEASYFLSIIGALAGIASLILLLLPRHYFVLVAPRGLIKPHVINLDPVEKELILELFNNGQIKELLKFTTEQPGPLSMEVWYKEGHEKVYVQLFQLQDSVRRPVSLVQVTTDKEIRR